MSGKISSVIDMIIQTGMKGTTSVISGLKSIDTAIRSTGTTATAAANANVKASNRMTHNTGKNFAAMSANISPIIAKFAEMAAAIYVVGFAYDKINLVAKFGQTKEAFSIMADTFNFNAELMVNKLKDLSNGTISSFEAMRAASISASSGLSTKQMENIAIAAKNASRAMGIDMSDAYTRLTRGIVKLEPELLDELGLVSRLQGELLKYSREMGISIDKIDSATKIQIFYNGVMKESISKQGALGVMTKSTAEELETMKNGLVDASLLFGEQLLPAVLAITNAFKDNMGTIGILTGLYVLHRTQVGLAASAQTYHTVQAIKAKAVAKEHLVVMGVQTTSVAALTAGIKLETKATQASVIADNASIRAKGMLSKVSSMSALADTAKGAMGKMASVGATALSVLTGPIGMLATGLALLANETGMLDGLWERLSGRANDLATQLGKLNKQQTIAYDLLVKDGIEKWSALEQAKQMGIALEQDLGGGLAFTIALLSNTTGHTRVLSQAMVHGADGTQIFLNSIEGVNIHLDASRKELEKENKVLKELKANVEDSKGWNVFGDSLQATTAALEKQQDRVKKLQDKLVAAANPMGLLSQKGKDLTTVTKAHDKSLAQLGNTVNLTTEKLKKLGLTKEDRLTAQITGIEEQIVALSNASTTAVAKLAELDGINTPSALKEVEKLTAALKTNKETSDAANAALERLNSVKAAKERVKALTDELALLKQQNTERIAIAESEFGKSDKVVSDVNSKYAVILASEKTYNEASKAILMEKFFSELISLDQYLQDSKMLASKNRVAVLAIEDQKTADLKAANEERIRDSGSMWENLGLDAKKTMDSMKGWGNALANTFKSVGGIISKTLTNELGKAFGFIEDEAKTSFDNALIAAQDSYAGMVKAANDAFGVAQRDQGTSNSRALQDIETGRIRDIADLTASRNSGSVDQAQFDQGVTDINTGVRRAQEDLGVNNDRAAQDAEQTRQDSILTAQEDLNLALLEADKQYAEDKAAVWDDMYSNIKATVFNTLTEIAVQKAAMWAWEAAGDVLSANTKIVTKTTEATAETAVNAQRALINAGISAGETTAAYAPIPFVGLGIAAGVIALMYASQSSGGTISAPSQVSAPQVTPAKKFHTGGLVTGASQEIPITAYKGEGVLNVHNGMKAIGGEAGLNQANATGSLGGSTQSKGNTTLILEFKDTSGNTNKTITLDNLEDLLRGAAGKTMRKVVNDGINLGYS